MEKLRKYLKEAGIEIEEIPELNRFKKILSEYSRPVSDKEILENTKRDLRKTKLPKGIEQDLKLLFWEDED
ncbi:hypothetical protein [Clostridium moutaii]|uniref:hypothetical protein n=1 Tax=Clostridium moutaii TaxID=3240932 RepID=UPI00350F7682